ncbi:MAG: ATP-binding protein [Eubacterium sp.]|nr:ATP-binding protein [Eubacterium sp.]
MIKRERYLQKVEPFLNCDLIKVLTGVRRCGKTVLLEQIKELLLAKGAVKEQFVQVNFESMKYAKLKQADVLYQYIEEKAKQVQGKVYIMLDEIQEVPEWQAAINSLRVDLDCDIYLTGSNSRLLSGELASCLSGRYIQIKVYPFAFSEVKKMQMEHKAYRSDELTFAEFLKYGGFPQCCLLGDIHSKETYLHDLYEAIVLKDIVQRHHVKDIAMLKNILEYLMDNVGNPFSARKISGMMTSMGKKIAPSTVLNYVEYFKEAYLLFQVSRYDLKGKGLLASTEKYYTVDTGIRNTVKKSELVDSAKLYENIVYLEMQSRGYEVLVGKLEDQEIDFICYRGQEKLYIQVAYLITPSDATREFGNLEKIRDNYPKYVISSDLVDLSRNGIIHKNIIQFLQEHDA